MRDKIKQLEAEIESLKIVLSIPDLNNRPTIGPAIESDGTEDDAALRDAIMEVFYLEAANQSLKNTELLTKPSTLCETALKDWIIKTLLAKNASLKKEVKECLKDSSDLHFTISIIVTMTLILIITITVTIIVTLTLILIITITIMVALTLS